MQWLHHIRFSHVRHKHRGLNNMWGVFCQKQVSRAGTSNYTPQILWDVIASPCYWYLLLAQHASQAFRTSNTWWRHQMETISALLAVCAGNSPVTGEFPAQRPATRSFDIFFDLGLYQQLSKQWRRRWFKTPWHSLWRYCNECCWERYDHSFYSICNFGPSQHLGKNTT